MNGQLYHFENPEIDKLLEMILSLVKEVYVLQDRVNILEKVLNKKLLISKTDINTFIPTPEEEAENIKRCDEFMMRIFHHFETGVK